MSANLNLPNRRTLRLKNYDYSTSAGFFITVNTFQKKSLLGHAEAGSIQLNNAGRFVDSTWQSLAHLFPSILLDAFVVMPNHVHGVFFIGTAEQDEVSVVNEEGWACPARTMNAAPTLGAVVGAFKSISAIGCNRILGTQGQPFWHRNYYEHVIRNDADLNRIREYIAGNPANWAQDEENPDRR